MKKTVVRVVALDLVFLLLLIVAGAFSGALSEVIYIGAYVAPLAAFFWIARGEEKCKLTFGISSTNGALCLPLIAPTVAVTVGLSALFAFLFSLVGVESAEPLNGSVFELLILHALLPAVLEEALFRYVPLSLIAPHSKRSAVLISALLFAFAHCSVEQIPYAFFAGLIFAALDLACGSILPSVALHLLNNVASVLWLWDVSAPAFRLPFVITVAALSVISVALVVIFRKRYAKWTSFLFDKDDKIGTVREVWIFVFVCLVLAVGALL